MVPVAGVEPAQCYHRRILSPLRLPIPSHRHATQQRKSHAFPFRLYYSTACAEFQVHFLKSNLHKVAILFYDGVYYNESRWKQQRCFQRRRETAAATLVACRVRYAPFPAKVENCAPLTRRSSPTPTRRFAFGIAVGFGRRTAPQYTQHR